MELLNKFFDYAAQLGISKEDLYYEKGENLAVVTFGEEGEQGVLYNVGLVFYDDETKVEVYIRKLLHEYDLFDVLQKANSLNAEYCGVSFFVDDDMLTLKSCCKANGELAIVLKEMLQNMKIAKTEFKNFG